MQIESCGFISYCRIRVKNGRKRRAQTSSVVLNEVKDCVDRTLPGPFEASVIATLRSGPVWRFGTGIVSKRGLRLSVRLPVSSLSNRF